MWLSSLPRLPPCRDCWRPAVKRRFDGSILETGGFSEYSEGRSPTGKRGPRDCEKMGDTDRGSQWNRHCQYGEWVCRPLCRYEEKAPCVRGESRSLPRAEASPSATSIFSPTPMSASAKIVSMGNKLDLDEIDYLRYLLQGPEDRNHRALSGEYRERKRALMEAARVDLQAHPPPQGQYRREFETDCKAPYGRPCQR